MPALIKSARVKSLLAVLVVAFIVAWFYWNHPVRSDMAAFAPADSLAFVETNDLSDVAAGIEETQAWRSLAGPIGARPSLQPNRWLIKLARWSGIGSADTILLARSQVALVFTGAEASQAGPTLTIKPLATLIIETHTAQKRMRPILEQHIEDLARRVYKQPALVRKQVDGVDLTEWSSPDGARQIITAFFDTAAIVGNDESSILHCIEARRGTRPALLGTKDLDDLRKTVDAPNSAVFGFVSKAGVKSLLQAFALYRASSSPDAVTVARIFADTLGNVVAGVGWSSRFVDGMVEDRCSITLAEGVADKLRDSVVPQERFEISDLPFVPPDSHSVSIYHFRDVEGVWRDLNALVSSHADLVGAIAARPMLQSLLKPYGIEDPETFVHAVGTRILTIRLDETSPAVLVTEAFDRPSLRKLSQQRLGSKPKTENVGDFELMLSASDNWATSFADNYFLLGPTDVVRRCLQARAQSRSLTSTDAFRRSERLVDISLPITALTFTSDRHVAISFVELFSQQERSAFSTNAAAIEEASRALPYAVSVSILKEPGFEWTSRSAFGLVGSLLVGLAPENSN